MQARDLGDRAATLELIDDHRDSDGAFSLRVLRSLKPVIAAVNGMPSGSERRMMPPMDFRVVAANAKLGFVLVPAG